MKTNSKIILLIGFCLSFQLVTAQEFLSGLRLPSRPSNARASVEQVQTLPFFEDFSTSRVYPDSTKWSDRGAFVNDGFPLLPPSRNAATLDVLDEIGAVYDFAISNPFIAEHLTSVRIRLDSVFGPEPCAITPADSVYLSFYYQPQGLGNAPEAGDSLVLEFGITEQHKAFFGLDYVNYSADEILQQVQTDTLFPGDTVWAFGNCLPHFFVIVRDTLTSGSSAVTSMPCDSIFYTVTDTTWYHVWSTPGQELQSFMEENNGNYFRQVMIPVTNLRYFSPNFFIRFSNYASIVNSSQANGRGNEDNWNIDLVYLNIGRSLLDTGHPLVCFSGQAPSFLKRYKSMPYKHYRSNSTMALNEQIQLHIANLDCQPRNINYFYRVDQVGGGQSYTYGHAACEAPPYQEAGFLTCSGEQAALACPFVAQTFSILTDRDTTSYLIRHYVSDTSCNPPLVDSLVYHQGFYNYFAYDDGIPEQGYGVEPAGSCFAVKFDLTTPDTIAGVQLLFNHTLRDANDDYFDIVIWKDNNGHPGKEITGLNNQKVRWSDHIFEYVYYPLNNQAVIASGTIYVGIEQQGAEIINIGFDKSTDNSAYNFYNSNGSWLQSQLPGSLCIRPVVGKSYYIGLKDTDTEETALQLFPNPASSTLHLGGIGSNRLASIDLYDLTGRLLQHLEYQTEISVSEFTDGLYFINITTDDGKVLAKKFMVSK